MADKVDIEIINHVRYLIKYCNSQNIDISYLKLSDREKEGLAWLKNKERLAKLRKLEDA